MAADRLHTHLQRQCDLGVGAAPLQQREQLGLTLGEQLGPRDWQRAWLAVLVGVS